MAKTVKITTRSRNIGIGWTNSVKQVYGQNGSYLRVADVDEPTVVGSRRAVLAEYEEARRGNSGNDWNCEFFVSGKRVSRVQPDGSTILETLRYMQAGEIVELELDESEED